MQRRREGVEVMQRRGVEVRQGRLEEERMEVMHRRGGGCDAEERGVERRGCRGDGGGDAGKPDGCDSPWYQTALQEVITVIGK